MRTTLPGKYPERCKGRSCFSGYGAVTAAKVTARGDLTAKQSACVVKVLRGVKLPASEKGVHVELALTFAAPPPPPAPVEDGPAPHEKCRPPSHWDPAQRRCVVAPCAGIPGGCPKEDSPDGK